MRNLVHASVFCAAVTAWCGTNLIVAHAQGQPPSDRPAVTVRGQTYTPRSILARNMGTEQDQTTQFPPHKVVGNLYYVGTRTLSAFLITTPQGHVLINTTYERNVPVLEKSVADLGFRFSDIKIVLGTHAHGDHQEGDALVKQKTGAQVMAMAEDVPALQAIRPGGKEHPIDKILKDGESVTLGGVTLVAHLTAGHTRGCTTWTTRVQDGGRNYDVVVHCSLRAPGMLTPPVVAILTTSAPARSTTTCRRSTRGFKAVAPTPSLTRRTATSKPTSRRRCSAQRWTSRSRAQAFSLRDQEENR